MNLLCKMDRHKWERHDMYAGGRETTDWICARCQKVEEEFRGNAPHNHGLRIGKLYITWWEQWSEIFRHKHYNWIEGSFVMLRFDYEFSPYKGSWEVNFGLLGLNVCFTWVYYEKSNITPNKDTAV